MVIIALAGSTSHAQPKEVGNAGPGPLKTGHVTAELTTLSPQIALGGTVEAGLRLTIDDRWHVYWVNAGDAGGPPEIKWTLPKNVTAGQMQFPPPIRLPLGPLMDFGYEHEAVFPVTITADRALKPGKIYLDARVDWLVCSPETCLPGKAHLGLDLNAVPGPLPPPSLVGPLGMALKALPHQLPGNDEISILGGTKQLVLTLRTGHREEHVEVYPFDQQQIENASDQQQDPQTDGIRIFLERAHDAQMPKTFHALLRLSSTEAYDVTAPVTLGKASYPSSSLKKPTSGATPSSITAISAIGLAFIGGLLLNLMPCVFPVLFLKGLALINSSSELGARQRAHGFVYASGILTSFWAIVALLLLLRSSGRELGWGFQLQSPGFVAVLAALMFFLALSLSGQFELGLSLTSAGGSLTKKQGFIGSFFTGVLATAVATPCMGPFMGAAVGFALAQPSWLTFIVFTSLALGLALPYLLLSIQPQWTRLLPRPGAWMETLKQVTAVPLFGTAIWLTWVYARLYGADGIDRMAALLSCYLLLAIAGWALGRWPAKLISTTAAIVLIAAAMYLPLHKPALDALVWEPLTIQNYTAARASGKPVFVDFTAAWCLSCQVNEHAVLMSADVETKLANKKFVLLKADWTQYDPVITRLLNKLNRSGVPTYVIYPPGNVSKADVLPELLSKAVVLTAIERN